MPDHYLIELGWKPGQKLTMAQRTSSLFAEEPVVLGKVLRRRSKPMKVTVEQWKADEAYLLRLAKAGAIKVTEPDSTPLTQEEIEKQEAELKKKQEAAAAATAANMAGDQNQAPAGEGTPAGAVVQAAPPDVIVPEAPTEAPPAPAVVPEEEGAKVPEHSEPHHSKKRGKR